MSLFRGYIYLAFSQFAQSFVVLITRILFARYLGPAQYGSYGTALNAVTTMVKLSSFGIVPSAQYFGSKEYVEKSNLYFNIMFIGASISGLIVIATFVLFKFEGRVPLLKSVFDEYQLIFPFACFVPLIVIGSILAIFLIATGKVRQYAITQMGAQAIQPVIFMLLILCTSAIEAVFWSQVFAWFAIFVLSAYFLRYGISWSRLDWELCKQILIYGFQSWPNSILSIGTSRFVVLFGATILAKEQMGLFIIASNISEAIFSFHSGLGQLIFTRVSATIHESFAVVQQTMRLSVMMLSAFTILYILVGKNLIIILFGVSYANSWEISLILVISSLSHVIARLLGNFLAGMGRPLKNTVTLAIEVLGLTFLVPILGHSFGVIGVAWAATSSAIFGLVAATIQSQKAMDCGLADLFIPKWRDLIQLKKSALRFYGSV